MATIRKIPFGYTLENGTVRSKKEEAETVVWIYEQYAAGESYKSLTDRLNRKSIRYDVGKVWNKNMVARILADTRYTGGEYPRIISAELSYQVRGRVQEKNASCRESDESMVALGRICYCSECGERVLRRSSYEHWMCAAYQAGHVKTTGERILEGVQTILAQISETPNYVAIQKNNSDASNQAIMRMENELDRELNKTDCDLEAAKKLAMQIAAEKYNSLGNCQYETQRLRKFFAAMPNSGLSLKQVLQAAVDRVTVSPDGGIAITLKNGQIVRAGNEKAQKHR